MEIANELEVLNLSDELYSIFVPSTMHKALSCITNYIILEKHHHFWFISFSCSLHRLARIEVWRMSSLSPNNHKHEKPLINKVMGLAHIKKCTLCGQTTKNIPRTFTVWREFDEGARGLLSFLCSAQSWRLKFFMQNSIQ